MITISKIQLTLQIEAEGLAQLAHELAAWQQRLIAVQAPTADGLSLPKPQNGPETARTNGNGAEKPKDMQTTETAPIAPAKRNTRAVPTLPFAEFDKLCRAEMKRLALDRRLPGRKLWDDQRDRRLPTLDAVRMRYKCATLTQLAEELGMQPPLPGHSVPASAVNGTTAADYTEEMAP